MKCSIFSSLYWLRKHAPAHIHGPGYTQILNKHRNIQHFAQKYKKNMKENCIFFTFRIIFLKSACFYHLRGHCVDVNWFPRDVIVRSCGVGVIRKMFFSDWDNSCKGPLKSEQRVGKSIYGTTSCRVDVTWRWNRADESKYWVDGDKLLPKYHKGKQRDFPTWEVGPCEGHVNAA